MSSVMKATNVLLLLASVSVVKANVIPSTKTLAEGVWTKGADLVSATDSNGVMSSLNGVMSAGSHISDKGQVYDESRNTWSLTTSSMRQIRESVGVVAVGDEGDVLVIGGYHTGTYLNLVERYWWKTGEWTVVKPLLGAHSSMGAVQLKNGSVLVCGGYTSGGALSTCEMYDPSADVWSRTTSMSMARARLAMAVLTNGSVLAVGGRVSGSSTGLRLVEIYNPTDETWALAPELISGRSAFGLVTLRTGSVMLFGGSQANDVSVDDCQIYDASRGVWETASVRLPVAKRSFGISVLTNGSVIIAGGIPGDTDTYIWTPTNTPSPPPTPPPGENSFRCEKDTCVDTGAGSGVPRAECEEFCGPDKYLCEGGRCVRSDTGGVSLEACQAICRPQSPSEPLALV
eukprot:m.23827 g.23827  ORF g.23827 m.23827 type:complete len:401 (+) comp14371_c0_seq1:2762-3964(+)